MRLVTLIFITMFGVGFYSVGFGASSSTPDTQVRQLKSEVDELKRLNKIAQESVELVRRDQLNYKIEKDILKDAYASNLQTIQLVLAIVLGVFTILGYMGLKGVISIRSEYTKELDDLRNLKSKFEGEMKTIVAEQLAVKESLIKLAETNKEQDRRLKVIEIHEKVTQLYRDKNYKMGLDYCEAGLEIEPKHVALLTLNGMLLEKFGRFTESLEKFRKAATIEPDNTWVNMNFAEALLITGNVEEYDQLYKAQKTHMDAYGAGALVAYLNTLRAAARNDLAELKGALAPYLDSCSESATARISASWGFHEARFLLQKIPDGSLKKACVSAVNFFEGKIPASALKKIIQEAT